MKKGDFVKLTSEVDEVKLTRMGIRKEVAEQMLQNLKEQRFEVLEVVGFGVVIRVGKREVSVFKKYVEKVA